MNSQNELFKLMPIYSKQVLKSIKVLEKLQENKDNKIDEILLREYDEARLVEIKMSTRIKELTELLKKKNVHKI
jgi:hypothetical protein